MLNLPSSISLLSSLATASAIALQPQHGRPRIVAKAVSADWPGWQGIEHMFVFGDSYTTIGFNDTGEQPDQQNPLGNPAFPGLTSSNGPNWVDFLTTTYNDTFLTTVDLAVGGATVDNDLVGSLPATVPSLKDQINDSYLPVYSSHPSFFPWTAGNTLFAAFFGINDVGNSYRNANASTVLAEDIAEYAALMDVLYQSGARNFLFLNVPPVDRSPGTLVQAPDVQALEASTIAAYNANITNMAANLSSTYADATTFVFDTNALYGQVLDDPCSHPETCPYLNTTGFCVSYENGTPDPTTFLPECGIPVDEYFWLNTLHPTFRMHNVTAQEVAQMLSN